MGPSSGRGTLGRLTLEQVRSDRRQSFRSTGDQRTALVGHSFDMPRAAAEFAEEGMEVIRAATGIPNSEFEAKDSCPASPGSRSAITGCTNSLHASVCWSSMITRHARSRCVGFSERRSAGTRHLSVEIPARGSDAPEAKEAMSKVFTNPKVAVGKQLVIY
jgi:hypothetical protein